MDLDALKRELTGIDRDDPSILPGKPADFDADRRKIGADWPATALTMIGLRRLDNIQACVERVLADGIPGDFLEAGVWRGGACIFMRAILKARGDTTRTVWVADSFQGLPPPDVSTYPEDAPVNLHAFPELAVPLEQVQANFRRRGLLDEQVKFLPGWFRDTFPTAPVERLAVLRLDGDMYESTIDGLLHLYPKLSPGGFVIIDDYFDIPPVKQAVSDYFQVQKIDAPIQRVDWSGAFWRVPEK
jgi:O-methyltransferase